MLLMNTWGQEEGSYFEGIRKMEKVHQGKERLHSELFDTISALRHSQSS